MEAMNQEAMQQRILELEAKLAKALYASQWEKLFGMSDDIKEFIVDRMAELSVKTDEAAT